MDLQSHPFLHNWLSVSGNSGLALVDLRHKLVTGNWLVHVISCIVSSRFVVYKEPFLRAEGGVKDGSEDVSR